MAKDKRPATEDELLNITSAAELGIVTRWSCGCALVQDKRGRVGLAKGGSVTYEQPALFCDGIAEHGHKARVIRETEKARREREEDTQGRLF